MIIMQPSPQFKEKSGRLNIFDKTMRNIRYIDKKYQKKKKSVGKTDESDLLPGTNNDQNTFH